MSLDIGALSITPLPTNQKMDQTKKAPTASAASTSEEFQKAATTNPPIAPPEKPTIHEFRQDSKLWNKLHVFIYDLRAFRSNSESRARLDAITALDYIGNPYFSDEAAERLRNTILDISTNDTLGHRLDKFFASKLENKIKTRMEQTSDYRVWLPMI